MKILQFGDLHIEKGNLDISIPPLEEIVAIAEAERPDLAVFTGDAVTKRGAFFPASAWHFRNACEAIAEVCRLGLVAIDGNHDVLFDGSPSFIVGALADSTGKKRGTIRIASGRPRIYEFPELVVAAIPTFDRYRLNAATEEIDEHGEFFDTAEGIVGAAVRGVMAEAGGIADRAGLPLVAVYHGSLAGAALGNEQVIRSGIDVPVPPEAFSKADAVLLGHIHKPQELSADGPLMIYQGASCPLDWGEKAIEPSVPIISIDSEDLSIAWERIPLSVVSQMIEQEVTVSDVSHLFGFDRVLLGDIPRDSRLRLTVRGPSEILAGIRPGDSEELAKKWDLRSVDLLRESTDEREHIVKLDKRVSMIDAVALWFDHGGREEVGLREPLLALAADIEGEVQDERIDAKFAFRPVSLRVENWCQYRKAEIPFGPASPVRAMTTKNSAK